MNKLVDDYISKTNDEQKQILTKLRSLIFDTIEGATEHYKWSRPVYSLSNDFCYLQKNKHHVNIGFMNIDQIQDDEKLLEGTGKTMRHCKIKKLEDINEKYLVKIIKQASLIN